MQALCQWEIQVLKLLLQILHFGVAVVEGALCSDDEAVITEQGKETYVVFP